MSPMPRRYILVKVVCDRKLTNEQFHEVLNNSTRCYFGEIGLSRIDLKIIRYDAASSTAIVSCEREAKSELESAMAMITRYAETPTSLLVLRVSGTVKGVTGRRK
jgi:RNase P/RNase MRP subunit POP5